MRDRRPAAEADALELMLLADIQASADRLSDIVDDRIGLLRKQSSAAWCGWPQIYRPGERDNPRLDVEELPHHRRVPAVTGSSRFLAPTPSFFSKRRPARLSSSRHMPALR